MPQKPTLLSTSAVVELLNSAGLSVTVSTVNRWAASGRLPSAAKTPGIRGARMFDMRDVIVFRESLREDVAS